MVYGHPGRCKLIGLLYINSWTQIRRATIDHLHTLHGLSPECGWSAPEIRPYGPLDLDPACSCFHYSLFPEGLRRSESPSLVLATENTIFSTSAACSLTFIRPSEVSTRAPAAALPPNSRGGIDD